jgi:Cache domain
MAAPKTGVFHSSRYLCAIGTALIIITLIGCGVTVWNLHRQTIEQSQVAVANLSIVLAEQTSRYVQVVDLTLQEVQSRVANLNISSPEEFQMLVGTEAMRDFLRERLKNLPQANSFALFKPDGRMFLTSRQQGPSDLSMADRDYFRHFVEHDDSSPFISAPVQSRVTGTPTAYIARRINSPDHTFLGLAVGAIDLQYLSNFYQAIGLPPGETVTLLRRDGLVLVRYPDSPDQVGKRMPATSPWYSLVAGKGGTYRSPGFLSEVPYRRWYRCDPCPPGRSSSTFRCWSRWRLRNGGLRQR